MTGQTETRHLTEHAVRSQEYVLRAMATVGLAPDSPWRDTMASASAAIAHALLDVADAIREHGAQQHG